MGWAETGRAQLIFGPKWDGPKRAGPNRAATLRYSLSLELCTQRRPLLPVPAEELTRSIRWSLDWQRAGRVTQGRVNLSQQLMG